MPRARLQALQSEFQLLILIYQFKTARKSVFQVPPPRSKDAASNWPFQSQCLPVSRVTRQQPLNEDYVIIQMFSWHKIKTTEYLVIDMQSFFKEKLMTIWYCSCRISIIVFSSQVQRASFHGPLFNMRFILEQRFIPRTNQPYLQRPSTCKAGAWMSDLSSPSWAFCEQF